MHALTMHHAPVISSESPLAAVVNEAVADGPSPHASRPTDEVIKSSALAIPGTAAFISAAGHEMGVLCLAVLTAALLLVLSALLSTWLRSARPTIRSLQMTSVQPRLPGRSPPCLTPSLSKLCVMRT